MLAIMTSSLSDLLLSPDEMAAVDRSAAASGIDSYGLMQKAGQAVAASALRLFPEAIRFVILCGPGNNGGDGYVAATALRESGAGVLIFHLGDPKKLKGDAARAFADCTVVGDALDAYLPRRGDVAIDAIFGAGLSRPVPEEVAEIGRASCRERVL